MTMRLWDGAMGSLLLDAGLAPGTAPEAWNIERPEDVRRVHAGYFQAGADVVQTNTFGANRARLAETRCPFSVEEVNRTAASIALSVRPPGGLVAGDLGPSGLAFPPLGRAEEGALADLFAEQAAALTAAGVDLLSVETISDLREGLAALRGIRRVSDLPVFVSLTFRATRRGFFTIVGDPAAASLAALIDEGASGVGANCTLSSAAMRELVREVRPSVRGTLLVQPNAGEPFLEPRTGKVGYPEGPDAFAAHVGEMIGLGVDCVGGCCGTTPEHIARIAASLSGGSP